MLSEIMDQRGLSSFYVPSVASSFFSEDICIPAAERQVGFWKPDSMPDQHRNKSVISSRPEKNGSMGTYSVECQPFLVKDQKAKLNLQKHFVGAERAGSVSMASWRSIDQDAGTRLNFFMQPSSTYVEGSKFDLNRPQYENSLFSSSLSEIFKKKMRLSSNDVQLGQSINTVSSNFEEDEPFETLEEIEAQTIGNLLPDDDDLLSGVVNELDFFAQPNIENDIDDIDLFNSGGGMELEADDRLSSYGGNKSSDIVGEIVNGQQGGLTSTFAGEHPYGEHPSRTLFVRNINSNVEDTELRVLFEQFGDIRTLYTACKHRGFVMISYYDIRAARNAMRSLQNKPLRRRKLDIHFSIPKDNPSEKDVNQGTLVVFNLDSSVSNDEIRQIFGVYGEIKEIRETPHKRHHKFIEFYDVRAAEAALRALNRSDIAGKRIKLEPSRPGGARRCLMQQFYPELDQEETGGSQQQESPPNKSPPGSYGSVPYGEITSSCLDNGAIQGLHSAIRAPIDSFMENSFRGVSAGLPQCLPSSASVASVGNLNNQCGFVGEMKFGLKCMQTFHPHSLPEYHDGGVPYNSHGIMSAMVANINSRPTEGIYNRHVHKVGSNGFDSHSFELSEGVFGASENGSCPLHGHHYVWSNPNSYQPHPPSPMMWSNSPSLVNGGHVHPPPHLHGIPRGPPSHMLNNVIPIHNHHVGSAPTINPSLLDRRHAYARDSAEASAFHPGSLGSMGFSGCSTLHPLELTPHNIFPHIGGNCIDPLISPELHSPQQSFHMFPGRNPMIPMPTSYDAPNERIRSRRSEASSNQAENKKQYELDIDRILREEDCRTTLMIKNIPNKYTSKMLLAAIDEHHRGTYDFIYLPIDFKNKCNVGYAFINMINPTQIVPFFQAFNGKKWEKFNSEKVASLAYARIQGKAALITHFQNSSLMNEDKRCRPILFRSDGPNAGDQEPFPMGVNIRSRPGKPQINSNEGSHHGSPSMDEPTNEADSSSGSSKE
eukprot:TRINITY_DN1713_c0_g1_i4.p1 TRINITY_DN1713_c0_g1~~TRINITY_DN1713_c0_g1_i4.p1  ORF type:complete len:994 (-),score=210.93 TRINITY_DN1713_c0_g1_i4:352-3333(-)